MKNSGPVLEKHSEELKEESKDAKEIKPQTRREKARSDLVIENSAFEILDGKASFKPNSKISRDNLGNPKIRSNKNNMFEEGKNGGVQANGK